MKLWLNERDGHVNGTKIHKRIVSSGKLFEPSEAVPKRSLEMELIGKNFYRFALRKIRKII